MNKAFFCYCIRSPLPIRAYYFWQFLQCLVVAAWQYYLNRCHPAGISMADMLPPGSSVDELGTGFVSQIFKRFLEYVISPNSDSIKDRCQSPKRTKETDEFYRSLYTFRDLGRTTIVKCVHKVCPMVEKPKTFKYKLTFLEFYEILFECSHCKIRENNMEYLKMKLIEDICLNDRLNVPLQRAPRD
ncbi:unnamed protein product [Acanthoscelides obtectus]|uniref:Uncharacterized protein n=1 Tax=Acanthoscelides obtectus TaxID=200917 RepID=A0A9P0MEZ5_ACAOB|nr:unnamed protein product [Acanthoscelides obtectus]CAK1642117.1 hypothetical protein AOBTE_LOCUS12839 [Acanthoscelides obtectus]